MWDDLSLDILSHILSYLPFSSLISTLLVSKHWHSAVITTTTTSSYLLTVPTRSLSSSLTTFPINTTLPSSTSLPLHFLPSSHSLRLVASTPSLLLFSLSPSLLLLTNPFTRHLSLLPPLPSPRSSLPTIALLPSSSPHSFRIVVAGGANASSYQQNIEVFDSDTCKWKQISLMPLEFAVRLTVWTPREFSYSRVTRIVYWMTSARVYSVVGYDVGRAWREIKVPMAERMEWAGLVGRRGGRVGLVGGLENGEGFVWELLEEVDEWVVVGVVPTMKGRMDVKSVVGSEEGVVCLVGMEGDSMVILVGRERERGKIEWSWVENKGCCCMGKGPVKALIVKPSLSRSSVIERLKRIAGGFGTSLD